MKTWEFFETIPGIEIHYIDEGQGIPVIFVPGWTFSADVFEAQIKHFSSQYRVIAIDPRAHGRSTMAAVGVDHTTTCTGYCSLNTPFGS